MNRKAQSSLEFLTTYGWMIMLVAIAAGALGYFGVFSIDKTVPPECFLGTEFSCELFTIRSTNSEARMQITNKVGEAVTLSNVNCTYEDGTSVTGTYPSGSWTSGSTISINCTRSGVTIPMDTLYLVDVTLQYTKSSGGFTKSATGYVRARAS